MLRNYLVITLRNLSRDKIFIAINVLGLGIAIACCITAYLNWDFSTNFDRNHLRAADIYRVQAKRESDGKAERYALVPNALGDILKSNSGDIRNVVRYTISNSGIRVGDEVFNSSIVYTDSAFFDLFTFTTVSGNLNSFQDKSQILISRELAEKYFNSSDVVGRTVTQINHDAQKEFTVAGVFEQPPLNSSFNMDAIVLWSNYRDVSKDDRSLDQDWTNSSILFLDIPEVSRTEAITAQLQSYLPFQNRANEHMAFNEFYLQNFKTLSASFHGETWLNGEILRWGFPASAVVGPAVMAILLLLLSCFNFTNTSIAVAGRRLKEIGIRKTMGGQRRELIAQFLGESILICSFALAIGMIIAEFLVPAYNSLWPGVKLTLSYTDNLSVFGFLISLLILTALIAGTYPAFYITSFKTVTILKGKMMFGGTNWFTRTLLTFQFVISLLCIVFGVAYLRNAEYQRDYDIGYAKSGVITAPVADEQQFDVYRNVLAGNTDIQVIGGSKGHVSDRYYKQNVKVDNIEHQVEIVDVGDDYMEAMNISLTSGRNFIHDSESDKRESVIVSEEFLKEFGLTKDDVGKRLLLADSLQLFIVGTTKPILTDGFWKKASPVMLRYCERSEYTQIVVRTSPGKLAEVNEFMKQSWKQVAPNTIYAGSFTDGNLNAANMINNNVVSIFGFMGLIAAILSATGLFSLVSLSIIRKTKEIGVRKILGASVFNIARVVNREFFIILCIASLFGGGLGFFASNKMMDAIWDYYRLVDIGTLLICIMSMFVISAITVSYKTIVASTTNPVDSLRSDS